MRGRPALSGQCSPQEPGPATSLVGARCRAGLREAHGNRGGAGTDLMGAQGGQILPDGFDENFRRRLLILKSSSWL